MHIPKINIKLLVMVLISWSILGVLGVLAILWFQWMAGWRFAVDSAKKHGIHDAESSRLGGLAVFAAVIMFLIWGGIAESSRYLADVDRVGSFPFGFLAVALCGALGLAEDVRRDFLTPRARLGLKFLVFVVILFQWPEIQPTSLGFEPLDSMLQTPVLGLMLAAVFLVGFLNAFNMADGANGLMPGVMTCAMLIFYLQSGRMVDEALFTAFAAFLLFNIVVGNFFLGDMGTYGIGCMLALFGFRFFNDGTLSLAFLAALFAYPCLDFLMSIFRRMANGRSPFSPDNDHLHNRLYFQLAKRLGNGVVANSMSGLLISMSTSGLVLLGYLQTWWPADSNDWVVVFGAEIALYIVAFYLCGRGRHSSQYAQAI